MSEKMLLSATAIPNPRDFTKAHSNILDRLVTALEVAFVLPDPLTLSMALGEAVDISSKAMLRNWICRLLLDMDEAQAAQRLPEIVQRLDQALNNYMEE